MIATLIIVSLWLGVAWSCQRTIRTFVRTIRTKPEK